MRTKTFDCVEMMDEAALSIYEDTKGMSVEEELAYWREREEEQSRANEHPDAKEEVS